MNVRTAALVAIALAFVAAEIVRPTHWLTKKLSYSAVPQDAPDALSLANLPPIDEQTLGSIDATFYIAGNRTAPLSDRVPVPRNATVDVRGWCGDPETFAPCLGLFVAIDDRARIEAPGAMGGDRPDVAAYYKRATLERTGFRVLIPAARIGEGTHSLRLLAISHDRRGYFLLAGPVDVTVE